MVAHTPFVRCLLEQLQPCSQVESLDIPDSPYTWRAVNNEPVFTSTSRLYLPGWYMLEMAVEHDQNQASARLLLDTEKEETAESAYLPLKQRTISKRLFFVPSLSTVLKLSPLDRAGCFTVTHLRIVWLTPWFAHDRLAQRLVNMSNQWKGMTKQEVLSALKQQAEAKGVHWRKLAMAHYDATFEHHTSADHYSAWLQRQYELPSAAAVSEIVDFQVKPQIAVLLQASGADVPGLMQSIESVQQQSWPDWQLYVACDSSMNHSLHRQLTAYARQDSRIRLIKTFESQPAAVLNTVVGYVTAHWLTVLTAGDRLATNALFYIAKAIHSTPNAGLLYCDEDKLDMSGERYDPHFKPDWNPDLLLAQNYLAHGCVYATDLVREPNGFRAEYESAMDHELALRVTSRLSPDQIVHIQQVLYHWRLDSNRETHQREAEQQYITKVRVQAVQDYLSQCGSGATVERGNAPDTCRIVWPLPPKRPLVSMLVPTRDRVEILQPCVDAILDRTHYADFELIILDNQSTCSETLAYMDSVCRRDSRVRVMPWNHAFNYSAINNFGAQHARGEILALINNDIEPINPEWLTEMVRQVCRPEIGCVGAKLYYPDDTIQHGGVILGLGGVAGHAHKYFNRDASGYFNRLQLAHNLSAVTAACLLVRKSVFEQVGGLNEEHLTVAFNDVDLCIKVREAGYRNLWTPYAELYHHESVSRGADDNPKKRARAAAEVEYMRRTWGELLDNDPAYNPNLTLVHEDFSLR